MEEILVEFLDMDNEQMASEFNMLMLFSNYGVRNNLLVK